MKKLNIGIDVDNTIMASKSSIRFFRLLSKLMYDHAEIHIITNREPDSEATIAQELQELEIRYHYLKITKNKAEYIRENGIDIFYEDTDEYFLELGEDVTVFKIREPGNFDFACEKKWIGSKKTVKMID